MTVSYKKLWKLLIDKNMMKSEMRRSAGITTNALAKMGKGQSVSVDVLGKVCMALGCNIGDIIEFIPDKKD